MDTLRNLLKVEEILAEVLNPHTSKNTLHDYCDGQHFKTHPLFGSNPQALQIIAYYDELEVVNPIGSYVKKHKLGCLSFSLGNIRPLYRSSLKAHYLVSVAKHGDIVKYGIDKVLRPFVEELKVLYCDGISISISGQETTFFGGLLAFLADNLAAHLIGGFKESMSFALRICRTCMITPDLMQESRYFVESNCDLRTPEMHFKQCSKLDGPLCGHYSTTYGVNRMSVLEEVPGFSVVTSLLHDIMHDLYEGIVPMELKLLLEHCISRCKYFSKDELNERLESFDFPENKPSAIDTRQSASQMMTLLRFLPLIIGDKVPCDDEHWNNFLLLVKICGIAMSPVFTHDNAAYLSLLVEEKLTLFARLFPSTRLIPKQHYMVHYARQIVNFGPLVQAWCMRQEAKLSFIKRVSRKSNFKNICKTAAKKHQFWLCYKLLSPTNLLASEMECSPKVNVSHFSDEPDYVQDKILQIIPSVSVEYAVKHPKWVKIQSSSFVPGVFVCVEHNFLEPKFGKILDIIVVDSTVILCIEEYISSCFYAHYNGFVIKSTGRQMVVDINSLFDHRPLHARHSFDKNDTDFYICLPYFL